MNPPPITESANLLTDQHYQALLQSDAELLDLYVLGHQKQALITLLNRFTPMITGVIRRVVSHSQDAEDAYQATCVILMQSAKKIRSRASIAAWLYGVAYRTACRVRAKSRRQATGLDDLELGEPHTSHDPIEQIVRQIELSNLDRELQSLPANYRDPLIEHYILGYTAREIAERMELSSSAVEGRLRRGRHMLRERLAERGASLSVCVAGVAWMRTHAQTASAGRELADQFVESTAFRAFESLSANDPYLFQLVAGETKVHATSIFKSMGFLGTFAAATVSLSMLALAMQLGTPPRRGGNGAAVGNAPGVQSVAAAEEPSVNVSIDVPQPPANARRRGGNPEPGGLIRNILGGNEPAEEVIKFTKPAAAAPKWLTAGGDDLAATEDTRDALRKKVDIAFKGIELQAALAELGEAAGLNFLLDETDFTGAQSPDSPVTFQADQIPVHEALALMLKPLGLNYEIHRKVVKITTEDAIQPGVRYYDLSHVLPSSAGIRNVTQSALALIEVDDPEPSISIIGSMMIVRCREKSHLQIEKLLSEVAKLSPENLPTSESQAKGGGVFKPNEQAATGMF